MRQLMPDDSEWNTMGRLGVYGLTWVTTVVCR